MTTKDAFAELVEKAEDREKLRLYFLSALLFGDDSLGALEGAEEKFEKIKEGITSKLGYSYFPSLSLMRQAFVDANDTEALQTLDCYGKALFSMEKPPVNGMCEVVTKRLAIIEDTKLLTDTKKLMVLIHEGTHAFNGSESVKAVAPGSDQKMVREEIHKQETIAYSVQFILARRFEIEKGSHDAYAGLYAYDITKKDILKVKEEILATVSFFDECLNEKSE